MNHTISGRDYQNLWFNGTLVGETGINAALCGTWGCPVVLVTGDTAACREGTELLGPGLVTVPVKQGLGDFGARNVAPLRARELIEEGAKRALADPKAVEPYNPGSPCEIRVEFKNTLAPDKLRHRHGVERVEARMIVSRADTWWEAWRSSSSRERPRLASSPLPPGGVPAAAIFGGPSQRAPPVLRRRRRCAETAGGRGERRRVRPSDCAGPRSGARATPALTGVTR